MFDESILKLEEIDEKKHKSGSLAQIGTNNSKAQCLYGALM